MRKIPLLLCFREITLLSYLFLAGNNLKLKDLELIIAVGYFIIALGHFKPKTISVPNSEPKVFYIKFLLRRNTKIKICVKIINRIFVKFSFLVITIKIKGLELNFVVITDIKLTIPVILSQKSGL